MGKVKLTLTVDEAVVLQGKQLAKNSKQSVSKLIEDFLRNFDKSEKQLEVKSFAEQLRGIAKSELSNMTDREIKDLMVFEKYGI